MGFIPTENALMKYTSRDWKEALRVFRSTGEIRDSLLVFFNQHGEWSGPWTSFNTDFGDLPQQIIPKERLVKICEAGRSVLLSSFINLSEETIEIAHHHVVGYLNASRTREFHAPNLVTVEAGMAIALASVFHAPRLEKITGECFAVSVVIFNAPELKTVKGKLDVDTAIVFFAPNLERVADLYAPCAVSFHAPMLKQIYTLCVRSAAIFYAPKLKKAEWIEADSAAIFDAPKLKIVDDYMELRCAIMFRAPCLQAVDYLMASSAINFYAPNLKTVEWDLDAGSATNFDAMKLEKVGGILKLKPITLGAAVRAGCMAAIAKAVNGI